MSFTDEDVKEITSIINSRILETILAEGHSSFEKSMGGRGKNNKRGDRDDGDRESQ